MSINEDEIALYTSSHPSLTARNVHIYFCERVYKLGLKNNLKSRVFIVATNGIFLIKKKNFSKSKISAKMSMLDISFISLAGMLCSFSSDSMQIRIYTENAEKAAFITYFIRQAQFPPGLLPIALHIPQENTSFNIRPETNFYKSRYLLADRILSCALHYNIGIDCNEIQQFYENESLPFKIFRVTPHLCSMKIFQPLMLSLAFEQDLKTLVFKFCNIKSIIYLCQTIFQVNTNLKRIVFDNCNFKNSSEMFNKTFEKFKLYQNELCFKKCDCTSLDFLSLFEALSDKSQKITKLRFRKSKLNSQALIQIFQSIFFNECYYSLSTLEINGIEYIKELPLMLQSLAGCSWALTSKCVSTLNISNCEQTDCSIILSNILDFDIGIRQIHMCNNNFVSRIGISNEKEIDFLNLRGSSFSKEAISSLNGVIYGLDLSAIKVQTQLEMTCILNILANYVSLPYLESFYFDENYLDSDQTLLLAKFISKLNNLKNLSLNCTASIRYTASGFTELCNVISKKKLHALYLRSNESMEFTYGELIIPMLIKLNESGELETLDITNQGIGSNGMKTLEKIVSHKRMKELRFDGCNSNSFESINNFCHMLISTQLKYDSWPQKEFIRHIKMHRANEEENTLEYESKILHSAFVERFSKYSDETDYVIKHLALKRYFNHNNIKKEKMIKKEKQNKETKETKEIRNKYSKFNITKRNEEMSDLITECIGSSNNKKDSAFDLLCKLDQDLSFSNLLSVVKTEI